MDYQARQQYISDQTENYDFDLYESIMDLFQGLALDYASYTDCKPEYDNEEFPISINDVEDWCERNFIKKPYRTKI